MLILVASAASAQQKAVTDTGEDVFLYDDGTWRYAEERADVPTDIATNPKEFSKPAKASFLVKSTIVKNGVWIDQKKWTFRKATNNESAEFEFQLKDGDLYGMLIAEKIEIPLITLRKIALDNARNAAPDIKVTKEEYRTVNGLKVLLLQMEGTMQGIKVAYYGYYFSDANGTVQLITYTAQSLLPEHVSISEDFLNGFVTLP